MQLKWILYSWPVAVSCVHVQVAVVVLAAMHEYSSTALHFPVHPDGAKMTICNSNGLML